MKSSLVVVALLMAAALPAAALTPEAPGSYAPILAGPQRSAANRARDAYRHPVETLKFFGLQPAMTVVEISPQGGWYTEILAPYLRDHGKLYAAAQNPAAGRNDAAARAKFEAKLAAKPAIYDKVEVSAFSKDAYAVAPDGSADMVLTFRNVHNWMYDGAADQVFASFYKALKPGGILGVEEHRGLDTIPQDPKAANGYVRQDYVIAMAKRAGFELVASSEIDANPRDTKVYPKGVWTLPPTFELGSVDHAKYADIGEADNMVLKFRKPAP